MPQPGYKNMGELLEVLQERRGILHELMPDAQAYFFDWHFDSVAADGCTVGCFYSYASRERLWVGADGRVYVHGAGGELVASAAPEDSLRSALPDEEHWALLGGYRRGDLLDTRCDDGLAF